MKKIFLSALILMFCIIFPVLNVSGKSEKYPFASGDCEGFDRINGEYCKVNYCTQAETVDIYRLISKTEYKNAAACFKNVFEPCTKSCSTGNSREIAKKCNTLLSSCIK